MRITKYLFLAMICLLGVSSCYDIPIPDEDPVRFSAEKQSRVIYVKNIGGISPINNSYLEQRNYNEYIINNDWLTIKTGDMSGASTITIFVKKNNTGVRRKGQIILQNLGILHGDSKDNILDIVQEP